MNEAFLRRAIELARESVAAGGGPFGAVVVENGEVVAVGRNRVVPGCDPSAHAEIEAIRAACRAKGTHDLSRCELYASCEPCPMCLGAIHWARIGRLRFACTRADAAAAGFDDALLYRELALPAAERTLEVTQGLRAEGLEAFRAWEAEGGRVPY